MIDMAPMIPPPAIAIPADDTRPQLVKSKKRKKDRRKAATVAAIGAIIILSDGSKCQVVAYDKNGNPLCTPVDE